jgi:hypothetical protein
MLIQTKVNVVIFKFVYGALDKLEKQIIKMV